MNIGINIKGYTVIIDEEDLPKISPYSWRVHKNKYVMSFIYLSPGKSKTIYMHRLLMGLLDSPGTEVDHKNRNPLDNRKSNIRMADRFKNNTNKAKKKGRYASDFKGVYYSIEKRCEPNKIYIRAAIRVNKKQISLGGFDTETDAALAYNEAASRYFGEFANLNVL